MTAGDESGWRSTWENRVMTKFTGFQLLNPLVLLLSACSEAPKTAEKTKAPEKPPEPLTGRQAFQMMYPQARGWAPDAQPVEMRSMNLSQVKAEKGKAGAWGAIFVSSSLGKS